GSGGPASYEAEVDLRDRTGVPPLGRLAGLLVSGPHKPAAEAFARRLVALAPRDEGVRVLGPAEAPIAMVRGRHRLRLLVKSPRAFDLSASLREWLPRAPAAQERAQLLVGG